MGSKVPIPVAIAAPATTTLPSAQQVAVGVPISPIQRLRFISPEEWEHFVVEWVDHLRPAYKDVQRCGGSGDLGRDVIGIVDDATWDNYQCKHYAKPLGVADVLPELAKLTYYARIGEYSYPRRYVFVAPQGGSTHLINILPKPDALKKRLLADWAADKIPDAPEKLHDALRRYVEQADFSILEVPSPQHLAMQHASTRHHVLRFGVGLPPRPAVQAPPAQLAQDEVHYVRALLDAYGDHTKQTLLDVSGLSSLPVLKAHFDRQREDFYSAESLRAFSRDTLPPLAFEAVQEDVYRGIADVCEMDHPDGYRCVQQATRIARQLPLSAHALDTRILIGDRGGICHQLANDRRLKWTK